MRCVIPGCKSRSEKGKKLSFFTPRTDEILRAWSKVICCEGEVINKKDTVCELHFADQDIEREYINKMPDGTISRLPRGKANLREGAVPSILLPTNGPPTKRSRPSEENKNCQPLGNKELLSMTDYKTIVDNVKAIVLPSPWCFSKAFPQFIVWNCWSDNLLHSSKRIVLRPNLKVDIFIQNKKIDWKTEGVCNMLEIVELLREVSQLLACDGTESGRAEKCTGYICIKAKSKKGPQPRACALCTKLNTKATKNFGRSDSVSTLCANNQKLRYYRKTAKNQNTRLHTKIKQEAVLQAIAELPEKQQSAVKARLVESKLKCTKGMRYTTHYKCLLLRIKSKKAYNPLNPQQQH